MKSMLKNIISLIILIFVFLGTAGCSSNSKAVIAELNINPIPTIKVSTYYTGKQLEELKNIINELNAKSRFYILQIQDIPATSYIPQLMILLKTNKAPDLIMINQYDAYQIIHNNFDIPAFRNISDKINNDKSNKSDNYFKNALSAAYGMGLPFGCSPVVLFYNKSMFDTAGIPYPTNKWQWEDFRNAAKALTKDTNHDGIIDQWGVSCELNKQYFWRLLISSYGGSFEKIASNQCINALNIYSDIVNTDKSAVPLKLVDYDYSFNTENVAMEFYPIDNNMTFNFNYGISDVPYETNKSTVVNVSTIMMNLNTNNEDAAYKALVDLSKALYCFDNLIPPTKDAFTQTMLNRINNDFDKNVLFNSLNANYSELIKDENVYTLILKGAFTPITENTTNVRQVLEGTQFSLGQ
jgi:multiple sugar transport system substrate-binding protein